MSDPSSLVRSATMGGIAADHLPLPAPQVFVAATHGKAEHNTVKSSLIPFACWRANDLRFEFESSFVLPGIATEIGALKELIDRHTLTDEGGAARAQPALAVFGHADPTGNDEFNKSLSDRRAQAIYGMLTRKTNLWEDLYSHPLGGDRWEPNAIRLMQRTLGQAVSDKPAAGVRATLFRAYMDHVCTERDERGQPVLDNRGQASRLELKPTDFLGNGSDPGGKADFQGCGEFNPVLMFSAAENGELSRPERKADRDAQNASSRRVVVFLFRPGLRIDPAHWPCPRVKEGTQKCRTRFWSDSDRRRTFQENRREFKDTPDTFACRFYDRLSNNSPCERGLVTSEIRLYDLDGRFIPNAPFELEIGLRKPVSGTADDEGIVVVRDVEVPNRCLVRWGLRPEKGEVARLTFQLSLFLSIEKSNEEAEASQRLHNLGFTLGATLRGNVEAFQRQYRKRFGLTVTGDLTPETLAVLRSVHDTCEATLR